MTAGLADRSSGYSFGGVAAIHAAALDTQIQFVVSHGALLAG